jgi:hypothetical protein
MAMTRGIDSTTQDGDDVAITILFNVVAQIYTGPCSTGELALETRGGKENHRVDEGCTGMAQGTLMQEQRFQLLGLAIGQQQRIILGQ